MLHEGRTDAILACGCLTFSPTNRINLGCPLFLSPQEYLSHLNRHHGMVLPTGSTHRAVTRNGVSRVVRVADSDKIFSNSDFRPIVYVPGRVDLQWWNQPFRERQFKIGMKLFVYGKFAEFGGGDAGQHLLRRPRRPLPVGHDESECAH